MAKLSEPKFTGKVRLARYIRPKFRLHGNRAAVAAFLADPGPPREKYLSVNNLDMERIKVIAEYYREELQKDDSDVAICLHKVIEYNSTAKFSGLIVTYNKGESRWEYASSDGLKPAYEHRSVPAISGRKGSLSHSGVMFIEALEDLAERKFARRMAKRKKFHLH